MPSLFLCKKSFVLWPTTLQLPIYQNAKQELTYGHSLPLFLSHTNTPTYILAAFYLPIILSLTFTLTSRQSCLKVGTYVRMYVETYLPITLIVVNFFCVHWPRRGKKEGEGRSRICNRKCIKAKQMGRRTLRVNLNTSEPRLILSRNLLFVATPVQNPLVKVCLIFNPFSNVRHLLSAGTTTMIQNVVS